MELQRLATIDELTGLFGRRHFMHLAERELARRHRTRGPVTAVMLDLDRFKHINDSHGHAVGDTVLRAMGEVLRGALRTLDLAGRLGGEEFAVLLPDTPLTCGQHIAERLREATAVCAVGLPDGGTVTFTASFGVAEHEPDESLDSLLHRADNALYEAKRTGRNRVVTAAPVTGGAA
nr:GGDEF domain-containing protein [Roseospira visakhapatnamensis]